MWQGHGCLAKELVELPSTGACNPHGYPIDNISAMLINNEVVGYPSPQESARLRATDGNEWHRIGEGTAVHATCILPPRSKLSHDHLLEACDNRFVGGEVESVDSSFDEAMLHADALLPWHMDSIPIVASKLPEVPGDLFRLRIIGRLCHEESSILLVGLCSCHGLVTPPSQRKSPSVWLRQARELEVATASVELTHSHACQWSAVLVRGKWCSETVHSWPANKAGLPSTSGECHAVSESKAISRREGLV
mmetsp:Transcript_117230/g.164907  ORF Transcript_117230/g.164907 Transcript_117230/m.164907 type:complete len:250 (+) Transcript_117230:564-1313(+)